VRSAAAKAVDASAESEVIMSAMNTDDAWRYGEKAMDWYGWGSPVGLGLLLLSVSGSLYLLHAAGLF
jgi:hypothetical protein